MEMPPQSSMKFLATCCYWQETSPQRNPSTMLLNHLSDLSWIWMELEVLCEAQ
jgi:hypothetical protein